MAKSGNQFLNNRKYHVKVRSFDAKKREYVEKRTTITMPIFLADLVAVKLTGRLSNDAKTEIAKWLQSVSNQYQQNANASTSQFFQKRATYFISDTNVSKNTEELLFKLD